MLERELAKLAGENWQVSGRKRLMPGYPDDRMLCSRVWT